MSIVVDAGNGPAEHHLACSATEPPADKRPEQIRELSPGVWYVDLTRAPMAHIQPALANLARASAVVFDVRGYPTDSGFQLLPHLIAAPESGRWMHVAKIVGPFGELAGWQDSGWNLKPAVPALRAKLVFMTDARAISYGESVMGYVADQKLGTIVGSATGGTNGNVCSVRLPGGFMLQFTGLRVTRHDGATPFHLTGVTPDIPAPVTLRGLREGRDEVLARALAYLSESR